MVHTAPLSEACRVGALAAALLSCACGDPQLVDEITDFSGRAGQYTISTFKSDARGWVSFGVYLPPGWSANGSEQYPLILFLHGQGGDETTFGQHVDPATLNSWIEDGLVPPFVLIAPRGHRDPDRVQWTDDRSVRLLTSEAPGGVRAMAVEKFRAGYDAKVTSVHGQSRGATGALSLILSRPESFASAGATSFVSDYAVDGLHEAAVGNVDILRGPAARLRMTIGAEDPYVTQRGRTGTQDVHGFLEDLGIPHEYESIPSVGHHFGQIWSQVLPSGVPAGLTDLRFHAASWRKADGNR